MLHKTIILASSAYIPAAIQSFVDEGPIKFGKIFKTVR
jgi:hypothetical protein